MHLVHDLHARALAGPGSQIPDSLREDVRVAAGFRQHDFALDEEIHASAAGLVAATDQETQFVVAEFELRTRQAAGEVVGMTARAEVRVHEAFARRHGLRLRRRAVLTARGPRAEGVALWAPTVPVRALEVAEHEHQLRLLKLGADFLRFGSHVLGALQRRHGAARKISQHRVTTRRLEALERRAHLVLPFHAIDARVPIHRGLHDAGQRVEIARRDRIELVIVTARAGEGQAQEGLAEHVDLVRRTVRLVLTQVNRRVHFFSEPPKGGADHRLVRARRRIETRRLE